jgi:hypothetical protein
MAFAAMALMTLLVFPATAEVVYTPVNVAMANGDTYYLDLNHDGLPDFALRSFVLENYCEFGIGYEWNLSMNPVAGAAVVATGEDAIALSQGESVDSSQNFVASTARMAELDWGYCGRGYFGQWRNLPNHYLGVAFRLPGSPDVNYGWAKVSEVASLDQNGHLQSSVILQSFAYETVPGRMILAGHMLEDSRRSQ